MSRRRSYTIVGRITLLVLGVSLLSLLMHGVMIATAIRPKENRFARMIALEVDLVRRVLNTTPSAQRGELAELLTAEGLPLKRLEGEPAALGPMRLPPPGTLNAPPPRPLLPFGLPLPGGREPPPFDPMAADVMSRLGNGVRLVGDAMQNRGAEREPGRHMMSLALDAQGEWWQLDFPLPAPPQREITWPLVGAFGFVAIAAALAIVLGVRSIARPLSNLSAAMLERRKRLEPIVDPEGAGREVRDVVRAFNQLVRALQAAQANQRNMLAGLSHDLRTPLARLRLRVELECPEGVLERAEPDFQAFERMISQFLAYTQGELAAVDDGVEESLMAMVASVVDEYREVGQPVAVAGLSGIDRPFPELALRRILSNLIDNALDHGQPPVEVELSQAGERLELIVYDHGKGIPESDFEAAASPFVKLGRSDPALGHTGLGLAIVTQIAERHGGRVIDRREPGGRFGIGVSLPLSA